MVSVLNLSAATTVALDTQNATNGECPGEEISLLDDINIVTDLSGTGTMNADWDVDRYHFKPAHAGKLTITLKAPQAMTIKAGYTCNNQEFYRSNDATTHTNTFHIEANQDVYLAMFDWETGSGYNYTLSIHFTPDQPDTQTSGSSENTSANTTVTETIAIDKEDATNGDCPGEHLQPLDGHNVHFIKTGTGTMHDG